MKLQQFSRDIIHWRKLRWLSQPDLAFKAKIPKSVLWHIETSPKANPTVATLYKIARALEVDITKIVR